MRQRLPRLSSYGELFHRAESSPVGEPLHEDADEEDLRRRRALQALEQQQAVFEQRQAQAAASFRLQRAMGWATFFIVPLGMILALIEPLTLTATGPAGALAYWNWRRLLRREPTDLGPTTSAPDNPGDSHRDER